MPKPHDVFDDPGSFWSFLTVARDSDFEGQHFDRKEAGRCNPGTAPLSIARCRGPDRDQGVYLRLRQREYRGRAVVLGMANGGVAGINHLSEPQLNSLTDFGTLLVNQSAEARFYDWLTPPGQRTGCC